MTWQENVQKYYPNAMEGRQVTDTYIERLENEFSGDRQKTLLATSLCADDINVTSTGFSDAFHGPFILGGLGGLPFAGKTGMTAYAHHIPDQGTAFIFYGPHIGITKDGQLGKMLRPGQSQESNSCGALMLALSRIQSEDAPLPYIPKASDEDFQQITLERTVIPFKQQILNAENPTKEITDVTYSVIHDQVKSLVMATKDEFHCSRVVLLGGVIINTDPDQSDWVDVRNFEVIELAH